MRRLRCGIPVNLSVGTNSGGPRFQIKQGHLIWKTLKMARIVEFDEGTLVYLAVPLIVSVVEGTVE